MQWALVWVSTLDAFAGNGLALVAFSIRPYVVFRSRRALFSLWDCFTCTRLLNVWALLGSLGTVYGLGASREVIGTGSRSRLVQIGFNKEILWGPHV